MTPTAMLVDTNVLLRIVRLETEQDRTLLRTIREYSLQDVDLCIALQNLAEFRNVATRPLKQNGFGRTIAEVSAQADSIAERFKILPETQGVIAEWRKIVKDYAITGVLVHDTRLAAIMLEYKIPHILTLNPKDFARFPFIQTIDPREAN